MGSKKKIVKPLIAISAGFLLATVGYTVHAQEAAKTGRPAAGFN